MSNCVEMRSGDLLERYVRGVLGESDQERLELHLLTCPDCLEELETLLVLRAELERAAPSIRAQASQGRQWRWAIAAGITVATLAAALGWWPHSPETVEAPTPSIAAGSPLDEPATEAEAAPSQRRNELLAELSVVMPPEYELPVLRGTPDEADRLFRDAMDAYQVADYEKARSDLERAAALAPDAPHLSYFLGLMQLLAGSPTEAAASFETTVAAGDSLYLEEARFHLAKARLGLGDVDAARTELEAVSALDGPRSDEAREILARLETSARD